MTSRAAARGFTLLEVMAAVLVLGLLYTVLAGAALRGLRSEGTDRRRATAALLADRELSTLEADLASGFALKDGLTEREQEPFTVLVEIAPTELLSLLPGPLSEEIARTTDPKAPSVLRDERGQSRVRRVSVVVAWDEAGAPDRVERTTYAFDKSALAQYFPSEEGGESPNAQSEDSLEQLRREAPPELQSLIPRETSRSAPRRSR